MTKACLKEDGKVDSERQRLRSVVIGSSRESKQDLRSQVGIISSGQEELDEERMSDLTSSAEVREKQFRIGGGRSGVICGEERDDDMLVRSLVILSEKRLRKAEGRSDGGIEEGSLGSEERLSRLFKEAQSLRGLLILEEICLR